MKTPPSFARSGVAVLVTAASAVALNVGIVRATTGSNSSVDEAVEVTSATGAGVAATLLAGERPAELLELDTNAEQAEVTPAAPAVTVATQPAPSTTKAAPVTPPPPPEPAAAVAAVTSYETFQINGVGSVVLANHGSSLEFWAAYTEPGWAYGTEDPTGSEIVVKFRGDNGEVEWKAKLSNGNIRITSSVSMEDEDEDDD